MGVRIPVESSSDWFTLETWNSGKTPARYAKLSLLAIDEEQGTRKKRLNKTKDIGFLGAGDSQNHVYGVSFEDFYEALSQCCNKTFYVEIKYRTYKNELCGYQMGFNFIEKGSDIGIVQQSEDPLYQCK